MSSFLTSELVARLRVAEDKIWSHLNGFLEIVLWLFLIKVVIMKRQQVNLTTTSKRGNLICRINVFPSFSSSLLQCLMAELMYKVPIKRASSTVINYKSKSCKKTRLFLSFNLYSTSAVMKGSAATFTPQLMAVLRNFVSDEAQTVFCYTNYRAMCPWPERHAPISPFFANHWFQANTKTFFRS